MSPSVMGEHYLVPCPECEFSVHCDTEQSSRREFLVCPNCGFERIPVSDCKIEPADTVEIEFGETSFERWDLVAFQLAQSDSAGIKRIVGLPKETIEIRDGNLWANGVMLKKPIRVQKEMRVCVHDTGFAPPRESRWSPSSSSSGWRSVSKEYFFEAKQLAETPDWLVYRHLKCYSHRSSGDNHKVRIEDNYGFNQSISRDLNPTDELFLEIDLTFSPESIFEWRFDHRGDMHEFVIDIPSSTLRHKKNSSSQSEAVFELDRTLVSGGEMIVEFSTIDRRLVVLLNRQPVMEAELNSSSEPVSFEPLGFAASKGNIAVKRFRIWRDVYYLGQSGSRQPTILQGVGGGYIVLGDNVPVSVDSRQWPQAILPQRDVLGAVKLSRKP